ncbi:MAG: protein kinase, partial [Comamonadaceae bacterium]
PSTVWPLPVVLGMAHGIASAAAHLHAGGILHGDLYGHNILHDGRGQTVLGDFGAASFVGTGPQAAALERIEVRAFGILLGEWLDRCDSAESAALETWRAWQRRCVAAPVDQRPGFAEIVAALGTA